MEIPSYYRFTSLPRDIDLALVEHRWMIVLAAAGGLAAGAQSALSGTSSFMTVLTAGLFGAASVFLAWAIGRELDPDHQRSALVGGLAGAVTMLLWGGPSILVSGWVLVLLRLIARTTGLSPRPADTLAVVAVSLGLGWVRGSGFLLLTAVGLALDGWLPPDQRNHKFAAVGLVLAWIVAQVAPLSASGGRDPLAFTIWAGLGAAAAAFLAVTVSRWQVEARADRTPERLNPQRVHAGQGLGVLLALGLPLAQGASGLRAQSALWAAILGIVVFHLLRVGVPAIRARVSTKPRKSSEGPQHKSGGPGATSDVHWDP